MSGQTLHQSVLLNEVVDALGPQNGGCYLDATFGNGGYSRAILDTASCTLLAIDRDPDAIARGAPMLAEYDGRFHLAEGCFSDMTALLQAQLTGFDGLDGAAFDLGVCSTQLDQPERGFSFRADGPLDMRMSKSGQSAADIVMQTDEADLARIFWEYGEEKASRRIAKAICRVREETEITSTGQLAGIIHSVMPAKRPGQIDPATRSFQALRIFVNRELDELTAGLEAVERLLRPGGILAVVSFHSLEDRIVKRFLASRGQHASRPSRHRPVIDGPAPSFEILSRKAILPIEDERNQNSRDRKSSHQIAKGVKAMRLILLSALILVGLGTTLYQVKTGIDERQDRLQQLELRIADTKRDIAVLEAEWAYLSRPERVMTLSGDLLQMTPIGQDRILPLDAIPMRIEFGQTGLKKIVFNPVIQPQKKDQAE
jgi:16S rRNA (cytosine1402-N4)-methyltransferase